MATVASEQPHVKPGSRRDDSRATGFYAAVAMLLGLLVGVLGIVAVLMWLDAQNTRNAANRAAKQSAAAPAAVDAHAHATAAGLESYAGAAPADAQALAAAHKPYPATLPAAPAGPVADANLVLT